MSSNPFGNYTVVDLTLPLGPDTIMWPGAPAPSADVAVTVKHDGYYARLVHFFEHSGTHVDAPNHFVEGSAAVTDLPLQSLISPAVVIDASVVYPSSEREVPSGKADPVPSVHHEMPKPGIVRHESVPCPRLEHARLSRGGEFAVNQRRLRRPLQIGRAHV